MPMNPSIAEQRVHYDVWNTKHRSGGFGDIEQEIRARGVRVVEHLRALDLDRPRILEVGCGTGWLAGKLAEIGEVTAIDLSPAAIEVADRRGFDVEFMAGDFYEAEFPSDSFDVIVCIETLFYVEDQPRFVEKLAEILRPGGVLQLTVVNKFVYERSSDIGLPLPGQVRRWLSAGDVRALLAPWFDRMTTQTVEPRGDEGVLRLVNSYKVNAVLGRVFSEAFVKRAKERMGFGGGVVISGRRREA